MGSQLHGALCFGTFGPNLGPALRGAGFGLKADGGPCWTRAPTEAGAGEQGLLVLSAQPQSTRGSPGPSLAPICSEWLHHGTGPGLWGQMAHAPPHSSVVGGLWPSLGSHCPCLTQQGPSRVRRNPPKLACSSPSPHRNHPFGLNFREGLG